jgi:hypothetical protein
LKALRIKLKDSYRIENPQPLKRRNHMTHAKLSPSASDRWTVCTASVEACEGLPDISGPAAMEGTFAHAFYEACINAKTDPLKMEYKFDGYENEEKEMRRYMQLAYDHVRPALESEKTVVLSEAKVTIDPYCWGTADVIIIDGSGLEIVDLKYGTQPVPANSTQILVYAIGALHDFGWMADSDLETVTRTIIQPRANDDLGPVRSITVSVEELEKEFSERVYPALEAVRSGNTQFVASEKGCRWCKKKDTLEGCDAFTQQTLAATNSYFNDETQLAVPHPDEVDTYSAKQVDEILNNRKMLSMLINSVEERAKLLIQNGVDLPNHKMVEGRISRKWRLETEEDTLQFLTKDLKLKKGECFTQKILSPAQAEKMVDVNARNGKKKMEMLQEQIVAVSGAPVLVHKSNKKHSIGPMFENEENIDPLS